MMRHFSFSSLYTILVVKRRKFCSVFYYRNIWKTAFLHYKFERKVSPSTPGKHTEEAEVELRFFSVSALNGGEWLT